MNTLPEFNLDLIEKYDKAGPRYTSYPTAVVFNDSFAQEKYSKQAIQSNNINKGEPISLYFHIPFCDTLCFFVPVIKLLPKNVIKPMFT